MIRDPDLPGLGSLVDVGVPPAVTAAFAETGSRIVDSKAIQVQWSPGTRATVRYRVEAVDGGLSGRRQVVAMVGHIPKGALRVEGPDGPVGVWLVPNDPLLPGLASAVDKPTVSRLLADLGLSHAVRSTRMRSYRPTRRAVVEVDAGDVTLYLKVVPRSQVEDLHIRHRLLVEHLPVPDSLGFSRDLGIVVMQTLPGVDLRTAMRDGRVDLPPPAAIAGVIASLPHPPDGLDAPSPIERVPGTARLLRRLLPDEADRIDAVAEAIGRESTTRSVPVHGDFHEAQLMTRGGELVGLLDVDTYGLGRPGDDPATMIGHLSLLARSLPDSATAIDMALSLNRIWDAHVDPSDLRRRVAAVVLGMAVGPFRVQRPNWPRELLQRLTIAEMWAASARRVDERSLIGSSDASHDEVARSRT